MELELKKVDAETAYSDGHPYTRTLQVHSTVSSGKKTDQVANLAVTLHVDGCKKCFAGTKTISAGYQLNKAEVKKLIKVLQQVC